MGQTVVGWDFGPVLRHLAIAAGLLLALVFGAGFLTGRATAADLPGWYRLQGEVCRGKRCTVYKSRALMNLHSCQGLTWRSRVGVERVACVKVPGPLGV